MDRDISQAIFNAAPDAMVVADEAGNILLVNSMVVRVFGYQPEELIGKKIEVLMPASLRARHEAHRESYNAHPSTREMGAGLELKAIRKDGSEFFADISLSPIQVHNTRLISAAIRDVTDRMQLTQQLNTVLKTLESKNTELEQFAYLASHDLQEPLRTLSSLANMLAAEYGDKLDSTAGQYLTYMTEAAARMKSLIEGLLAYSRIGREKQVRDVHCQTIICDIIEDFSVVLKESGAVIFAEDLPVVRGHDLDLRLLFQNLISNAIKFRRPGVAPTIHIEAKRQAAGWLFAVADNGIGIPEQFREKIFEIFQRLHTRNQYKGTGIGLAHCKKIVEFHQGKIWVEPGPESGSTFCFTLPFLS